MFDTVYLCHSDKSSSTTNLSNTRILRCHLMASWTRHLRSPRNLAYVPSCEDLYVPNRSHWPHIEIPPHASVSSYSSPHPALDALLNTSLFSKTKLSNAPNPLTTLISSWPALFVLTIKAATSFLNISTSLPVTPSPLRRRRNKHVPQTPSPGTTSPAYTVAGSP